MMDKNSRRAPIENHPEPMIGTIQWKLGLEVQPNQNKQIGSANPPTQVAGSRASGVIFPLSSNLGRDICASNKKKKNKKRNHKDGAGQDTDELESFLPEVEAIYPFEHNGERLEPHIEKSVNEGQVFNTVKWPLYLFIASPIPAIAGCGDQRPVRYLLANQHLYMIRNRWCRIKSPKVGPRIADAGSLIWKPNVFSFILSRQLYITRNLGYFSK